MRPRGGRWAAWPLRAAGVLCLGCWLVPSSTYAVSPGQERATFALGWPTAWFTAEATVEPGYEAILPDLNVRARPLRPLGRDRIWTTPPGAVDAMPKDVPGLVGWSSTVCRRRERVNPEYGPLALTVVGVGCLYVAGRVTPNAGRGKPQADADAAPPPPV